MREALRRVAQPAIPAFPLGIDDEHGGLQPAVLHALVEAVEIRLVVFVPLPARGDLGAPCVVLRRQNGGAFALGISLAGNHPGADQPGIVCADRFAVIGANSPVKFGAQHELPRPAQMAPQIAAVVDDHRRQRSAEIEEQVAAGQLGQTAAEAFGALLFQSVLAAHSGKIEAAIEVSRQTPLLQRRHALRRAAMTEPGRHGQVHGCLDERSDARGFADSGN